MWLRLLGSRNEHEEYLADLDFRWFLHRKVNRACFLFSVSVLPSVLGKKSLGSSLASVGMWMSLQEIQMLSSFFFKANAFNVD